jgi:hypothetical protein
LSPAGRWHHPAAFFILLIRLFEFYRSSLGLKAKK